MTQVLDHASNMVNIYKEVQNIYSGTLDHFVPEQYQKCVKAGLLVALRIFNNVVR